MIDFKTSILERSGREKTVRLKDGSTKQTRVKGGFFYRIQYVDQGGRGRTVEKGPFRLKVNASDALNTHLAELRPTQGRSHHAEGVTFSNLADLCSEKLFYAPEYVTDPDGTVNESPG